MKEQWRGPAAKHLCITINEDGKIELTDSSICGSAVSYDNSNVPQVRTNLTRNLDLAKENHKLPDVEVKIPSHQGLMFEVKLAGHRAWKTAYDKNVQ